MIMFLACLHSLWCKWNYYIYSAVLKFSNGPWSEPLLAWKRANWVQETCLLIQNTVLRAASLYFHRGLRKCFANDYMRFFDSPVHSRLDNDVSGRSPTNIQNSCPFRPGCARSLNSLTFFMKEEYVAWYSFLLLFAAPSRVAALLSPPLAKCTSMWVNV